MQAFIAKIGKGKKTGKDLTWGESKQAMRLLIEGEATPAQVGAFLLAMRIKMESVTELAAFTAAAREYVPPLPVPGTLAMVDLPVYAGKRDTFHAVIGSAIIAAAAGSAVLMHGSESDPERPGPVPVLAHLGIPTQLDATGAADRLVKTGFAYLDMALYYPPVARFLELRRELGLRTLFSPVTRMLNPARAQSQVIGVSHPPYLEKITEALKMLGTGRALIVQGVEGDPELSLAAGTKVLELRDGRVIPLMISPKDFGLSLGSAQDMAGFSRARVDQEAALLRRILSGEVRGAPRDWIVMNAAMLVYASGKASSSAEALPLALRALDSGAAAQKLLELAETSDYTLPLRPEQGGLPDSGDAHAIVSRAPELRSAPS